MRDVDSTVMHRLEELGRRAESGAPPVPAAVLAAVGKVGPGRPKAPLPALVAAALVIAAGGLLVVVGVPVPPRQGGGSVALGATEASVTVVSMMARFNRVGTVDAAVVSRRESALTAGPVYRAADARRGELPE